MEEVQNLLEYLEAELRTRSEQGCETWELERELELLRQEPPRRGCSQLEALAARVEKLAPPDEFPYVEPNDLEEIRMERPGGPRSLGVGLGPEELAERTLGGWLGRVAGCQLGRPVEGWDWQQIHDVLEARGALPLRGYIPVPSEEAARREVPPDRLRSMKENLTCGVRDDDLDYTVLGLKVLEQHGKAFTSRQVAERWLELLPYARTCTAERVAYGNLVNRIWPPRSAQFRNPYREWIGAQIRADIWGYVCPGRPEEAAGLAFRDARISHTRNGIYGEMWVAAMVAAAFAARRPRQVITIGLSEVPQDCRLAEAVRRVLGWNQEGLALEAARRTLLEEFSSYNWVHAIPNAAVVAMALLWGEGEFGAAVGTAVEAGLDTDCNGATVGSIAGVLRGASDIPRRWTEPLNDRLESAVSEESTARICALAERTGAVRNAEGVP